MRNSAVRNPPSLDLDLFMLSKSNNSSGSEDEAVVLSGGSRTSLSSPLRRSNSKVTMAVDDEASDSKAAGTCGMELERESPALKGLYWIPLMRIASGEVFRESSSWTCDESAFQAQNPRGEKNFLEAGVVCCTSNASEVCMPSIRRSHRLAHAFICACFVMIIFSVSHAGNSAVSSDIVPNIRIDARRNTTASRLPQLSPVRASLFGDSLDTPGRAAFRMLTVCTGNTCRSPMMKVLLQTELQRLGLKNVVVDSAGSGVRAAEHRPASAHALTLFPHLLKDHRSMRITELSMLQYDMIFCMTNVHKEAVVDQCVDERKNETSFRREKSSKEGPSKPQREVREGPHDANILNVNMEHASTLEKYRDHLETRRANGEVEAIGEAGEGGAGAIGGEVAEGGAPGERGAGTIGGEAAALPTPTLHKAICEMRVSGSLACACFYFCMYAGGLPWTSTSVSIYCMCTFKLMHTSVSYVYMPM